MPENEAGSLMSNVSKVAKASVARSSVAPENSMLLIAEPTNELPVRFDFLKDASLRSHFSNRLSDKSFSLKSEYCMRHCANSAPPERERWRILLSTSASKRSPIAEQLLNCVLKALHFCSLFSPRLQFSNFAWLRSQTNHVQAT